jgi:hypothetical protein
MNVAVDKASALAKHTAASSVSGAMHAAAGHCQLPAPPFPSVDSSDTSSLQSLRWLVQEIILPSSTAAAAQVVAGLSTDPSQEVVAKLVSAPLLDTFSKHATILQTVFLHYSHFSTKSSPPVQQASVVDGHPESERQPPWTVARVNLAGFMKFAADFQLCPELVAGDHLETIFERCSVGLAAGLCYPTWCEAIGWSAMVVAEEQRFSGVQPPPPVDDVLELENLLAFMSQTEAAVSVEQWLLGYTERGLSPAFAWD